MPTPFSIRELQAPLDMEAGVCELVCPVGDSMGTFVFHGQRDRTFIRVVVTDPVSGILSRIECLFDTGAKNTIIPRQLLASQEAFTSGGSTCRVSGIARGRAVMGKKYRANLLVPSQGSSLTLGDVDVIVVAEGWAPKCAVLGVDALALVVSVLDDRTLSLWPATSVSSVSSLEGILTP